MAASVNKHIIVGNLGQDPTESKGVVTFSVATSESFKDKEGNKQEETEWHKVVCFRKNDVDYAMKFLMKGSQVYVEGKKKTKEWEGKQYVSLIADNVTGLAKLRQLGDQGSAPAASHSAPEVDSDESDDLPF